MNIQMGERSLKVVKMQNSQKLKYFGWSSISIESEGKSLFFDPFFRPYCGAQWSTIDDYLNADVVCITHGHEEHFLDTPEVVRRTGATVVSSKKVCRFLQNRSKIPESQLAPVKFDETFEVSGFKITTFPWKHRDINLFWAMPKALFTGNTTQLSWAWSSATKAPFSAPYTGFHVELPDGTGILNYNEGFNSKMTDREIQELGQRFKVDVLLAGMQLDFTRDLARGVAALAPKTVILYPPHEKFHEMMGATSEPWTSFAEAARTALPQAKIVIAEPGDAMDIGRDNS
jgi:hypothetical protein